MCFRIFQHALVHDVRPLVTYKGSQEGQFVNPYAQPRPCCRQDYVFPLWFRCEFGHGCCLLIPRLVKCTNAVGLPFYCNDAVSYHTYQPAEELYHGDGPDNVVAEDGEGWYPWRTLHEEIGQPDSRNQEFKPHQENVMELVTAINAMEQTFKDFMIEFRQLEAKYRELKGQSLCDSHDVCMRVLNELECPEYKLRRDQGEMKSRLIQIDQDLTALETRLNIRRMILDAIARGFVGECGTDLSH